MLKWKSAEPIPADGISLSEARVALFHRVIPNFTDLQEKLARCVNEHNAHRAAYEAARAKDDGVVPKEHTEKTQKSSAAVDRAADEIARAKDDADLLLREYDALRAADEIERAKDDRVGQNEHEKTQKLWAAVLRAADEIARAKDDADRLLREALVARNLVGLILDPAAPMQPRQLPADGWRVGPDESPGFQDDYVAPGASCRSGPDTRLPGSGEPNAHRRVFFCRSKYKKWLTQLSVKATATSRDETRATADLKEALKDNPNLTVEDAYELVKSYGVTGRGFRQRVWPDSRVAAGLSRLAKRGPKPKAH
jgi:hypothetical protein